MDYPILKERYPELESWKDKFSGKGAHKVEGPRRVSKSTILEEFA